MEIPAHIKQIASINLTEYGMMCLACYPREATEHADRKVAARSHLDEVFNFFAKICENECTSKGYPIDRQLVAKLVGGSSYKHGDAKTENNLINKIELPKRSPSTHSQASKGSPERGRHKSPDVPAWVTAQSNRQAEEYDEIKRLRDVDQDEYIRRIRAKQKPWTKGQPHEETYTAVTDGKPTELDITWEAWCRGEGAVYLEAEKANPDLNGSAYQRFLGTPYGTYLLDRKPILRKLLEPLLSKAYPSTGQATDQTGTAGAVPEPTAATLSQLKDSTMWPENTVPSPSVVPYIDETSPWEEI